MPVSAIKYDKLGPYYDKSPHADLEVEFDWTDWETAEGSPITTSVWEATLGLTLTNPTLSRPLTSVNISGGQRGRTYVLTNIVSVAGGFPRDARELRVKVGAK